MSCKEIDLQDLKALAEAVKGWGNCTEAWLDTSEDYAAAVVGHIDEDGNAYPVTVIDCDQYYRGADSLKLAKFYAAANPAMVLRLILMIDSPNARLTAPSAAGPVEPTVRQQPRLTVRLSSFPESNGKRNWTALLVRADKWNGLIGNCGGITIARGELWNRVAYEAECTRALLGERDAEPHILDYGDDIKTPEEWVGEVRGGRHTP